MKSVSILDSFVYFHYSHGTWAWCLKSLVIQMFVQQFVPTIINYKEIIKALHFWPFVRENHWWWVDPTNSESISTSWHKLFALYSNLAPNNQWRLSLLTDPYRGYPPKGPYPPCLRMADRALLAGYPWYMYYSAKMSWVLHVLTAVLFIEEIWYLRYQLKIQYEFYDNLWYLKLI